MLFLFLFAVLWWQVQWVCAFLVTMK